MKRLKKSDRFDFVIGIKASGRDGVQFTQKQDAAFGNHVVIHTIPYSEHSSLKQLQEFVKFYLCSYVQHSMAKQFLKRQRTKSANF